MRRLPATLLLLVSAAACGGKSHGNSNFFFPKPDLKARNLVINKTALAPGESVLVTVDVRNDTGDGAASSHVAVYASLDATVDKSDFRMGSASTPALPTSPSFTQQTFNVVAPATPGVYTIAAFADDSNEVSEDDEGNNQSNTLTITVN